MLAEAFNRTATMTFCAGHGRRSSLELTSKAESHRSRDSAGRTSRIIKLESASNIETEERPRLQQGPRYIQLWGAAVHAQKMRACLMTALK